MIIKDLIKRNMLAYETIMLFLSPFFKIKYKNREKVFLRLSKKEIMDLNAEMYYKRRNKQLDWNHLVSYTEKMQYEKIFDDNPLKTQLSDKYLVREWIREKIGEEYLIPLIGVWDKFSQIDFDNVPNSFVIKTNHGSSDVVIVRDKKAYTLAMWMRLKRIITNSMNTNYSLSAYELHYSEIAPKIIIEQYIDSGETDLQDYKFLCFDGKPYFCWVDVGRYHNHKRNLYNMDWELQDWNQYHYGNSDYPINKPINFEKMQEIATILSKGFSHVRVDLYNVDGRIYFGEMTFTNGSGFEEITPDSVDLMLGELWKSLKIDYNKMS